MYIYLAPAHSRCWLTAQFQRDLICRWRLACTPPNSSSVPSDLSSDKAITFLHQIPTKLDWSSVFLTFFGNLKWHRSWMDMAWLSTLKDPWWRRLKRSLLHLRMASLNLLSTQPRLSHLASPRPASPWLDSIVSTTWCACTSGALVRQAPICGDTFIRHIARPPWLGFWNYGVNFTGGIILWWLSSPSTLDCRSPRLHWILCSGFGSNAWHPGWDPNTILLWMHFLPDPLPPPLLIYTATSSATKRDWITTPLTLFLSSVELTSQPP